MKHSFTTAIVLVLTLGVGREARAQWSYCNSGTAYNGTCYEGSSTSGWTNISATSTAGNAVVGTDTSSGNGVQGQSSTGIGVIGSSHTSQAAPSSEIGVFGVASSSSTPGAGVYGLNVNEGYGVYGTAVSADAIHGVYTGSGGSSAVAGVANTSGNGVYGSADNASYYAIEGHQNNASGYTAYFYGGLGINLASGLSYWYNGGTCIGGFCASDRRLKNNITPLADALGTLLRLKGVTYEWKKPEEHGNLTGPQMGFIAQDVERVFPQWVDENSQGVKGIVMSPLQISALEVESIRTLKTENDVLQARATELEDRVKSLEAGRRPVISGFGEGGIGLGLLAVAGAIVASLRRRRAEEQSSL